MAANGKPFLDPMPETPITQRDIAKALGLSQATISLALSGRGKISDDLRERIRGYAEKHGYRMDPALSALAAYRRGKRQPGFQGTVAWVTNFDTRDGWKIDTFVDYHAGAESFLAAHGYGLETLWLGEPGMTAARMSGILRARGIECLLLCPQQHAGMVADWDFSGFSVVTFGFTLEKPRFHMVTAQGFTSMRILCDSLRDLGHRAIGFAYGQKIEERSQGSWLGGYLVSQSLDRSARSIPPLRIASGNDTKIPRWLDRHKPDAVICTEPAGFDYLRKSGCRIPDDFSFCLTVADPARGIGGMTFDNRRIGEIAARKVIGLHHARERGTPPVHEFTAIEGVFDPGKTVTRRG